jgi:hypothetical protein
LSLTFQVGPEGFSCDSAIVQSNELETIAVSIDFKYMEAASTFFGGIAGWRALRAL